MSAFTTFSQDALEEFLLNFDVGNLISWTPIRAGIENSNYFVITRKHDQERNFVLTIMEILTFEEIPFFNSLLMHLSHYGLPVPAPQQTLENMTSTTFCEKPTVLVPKLAGKHPVQISANHCIEIGQMLGEIHCALATTNLYRANPFDVDWMFRTIENLEHELQEEDRLLLKKIADEYADISELSLPRGITHGDLFRDNALFEGEKLTGVIDFYRACNVFLIQDIAITINEWCRTEQNDISAELSESFIQGYESKRPLENEERESLPNFQLAACARFTLTRLLSGVEGNRLKDPNEYMRLAARLS